MATEITNMFCRLNDLNNEAAVETFLVNRLLTRLGYPDSRIRTKESIESLPIPRGSSTEHYRPDYVLLDPQCPSYGHRRANGDNGAGRVWQANAPIRT